MSPGSSFSVLLIRLDSLSSSRLLGEGDAKVVSLITAVVSTCLASMDFPPATHLVVEVLRGN
jgi:hypothetical protein